MRIDAELVNVLTGSVVSGHTPSAPAANLRNAAHRIADALYEKIIGVKGAFATRIAYMSVDGKAAQADATSCSSPIPMAPTAQRIVMRSPLPIMSPAWSPGREWLAYVSFERRVSAVFVQEVAPAGTSWCRPRAGINGAPTYSPDGKKLALTLSGSNGNLDIYLLDLGTQQLTRLTDDPGIDTEASFDAKGNAIYFTSDRSGSPQVYKLDTRQQRSGPGASPSRAPTMRVRASHRTANNWRCSRWPMGAYRIGVRGPALRAAVHRAVQGSPGRIPELLRPTAPC